MVEKTLREQQLPLFKTKYDKEVIQRVIDIIMDEFVPDAPAVIAHALYRNQNEVNDYLEHSCIMQYLEQLDSRISNKTEDQKAFEQAYGLRNSTSVK